MVENRLLTGSEEPGYEPEGREFDSLRARHFPQGARNKVGYLILRDRVSISSEANQCVVNWGKRGVD
jgi:hypothetical protein